MTDRSEAIPGGAEFVADWQRNADHLVRQGLYDPAKEHDACGVGFEIGRAHV